jgi:hypothetical protein
MKQNDRSRIYGVLGLFWPSKKFADKDLIPGGAASAERLDASSIEREIARLGGFFSAPDANQHLQRITRLLPDADTNMSARDEIIESVREIMRGVLIDSTNGLQNEDNVSSFLTLEPRELLETLSTPPRTSGGRYHTGGKGGAASLGPGRESGGAAGITFSGIWEGLRNVINYATYYEMKNRAGIVGRGGVYAALRQLRGEDSDRKLHLVGQSFGARVVTAAVDGPGVGSSPVRPQTVTLAQAAFSHYAFAVRWDGVHDGMFRDVLTPAKLLGPMLVTHSSRDRAVGVAYAIASRLANQVASAIGDEHDIYGGLGRNGALKCAATEAQLGAPAYHWTATHAHNLAADQIIRDHSDIAKRELGDAILSAIASS